MAVLICFCLLLIALAVPEASFACFVGGELLASLVSNTPGTRQLDTGGRTQSYAIPRPQGELGAPTSTELCQALKSVNLFLG